MKRLLPFLIAGCLYGQSGAVGVFGVYNSATPQLTNGTQNSLQVDQFSRLIIAPLQAGNAQIGSIAPLPIFGANLPGLSPQNGALILGQYNANLPIVQVGQSVPLQVDSLGRLVVGSINALPPVTLAPMPRALPVVSLPAVSYPSYSTSATVTLASSATDFACLPGNNSNIVIVYDARLTGIQTTAGVVALYLVKRSTADTGSSNSMTAVPDDASYPAASSAPINYTSNPTTGTLIGNEDISEVGFMATGTAAPDDVYVAPTLKLKPVVLRGTAQELCFNMNGVTVTGGTAVPVFRWFEVANLAPFTP